MKKEEYLKIRIELMDALKDRLKKNGFEEGKEYNLTYKLVSDYGRKYIWVIVDTHPNLDNRFFKMSGILKRFQTKNWGLFNHQEGNDQLGLSYPIDNEEFRKLSKYKDFDAAMTNSSRKKDFSKMGVSAEEISVKTDESESKSKSSEYGTDTCVEQSAKDVQFKKSEQSLESIDDTKDSAPLDNQSQKTDQTSDDDYDTGQDSSSEDLVMVVSQEEQCTKEKHQKSIMDRVKDTVTDRNAHMEAAGFAAATAVVTGGFLVMKKYRETPIQEGESRLQKMKRVMSATFKERRAWLKIAGVSLLAYGVSLGCQAGKGMR